MDLVIKQIKNMYIKEIFKMESDLAKEKLYTQMETLTLENGKMIKCMVKVSLF